MKDFLNNEGAEDLEDERKNQKTREEVELILSTGDSRTLENVQLVWDGVEGWTLFELVGDEQVWVQDKFLVYYRDPEGGA